MAVIIDYDKPEAPCGQGKDECIILNEIGDCLLLARKGKYYGTYEEQYADCPLREYVEDEDDGK